MKTAHIEHYAGLSPRPTPRLKQVTREETPYIMTQARIGARPQSHIEHDLYQKGVLKEGMFRDAARGAVAAAIALKQLGYGRPLEFLAIVPEMSEAETTYAHGYNIGLRALLQADVQAVGVE